MALPKTQALRNSTFTVPPLDGTLTIPGLYEWHYEHSPDHPLFIFEDEPGLLRTICYREAVQAIVRASRYALKTVGEQINDSQKEPPVVAILAMSDTVTSFCTIVGFLRLGWNVFPISTRNSPQAITALLSQTNSKHLFLSSDPVIRDLAKSSLDLLPEGAQIQTHDMPVFEDLYPTRGPDPTFEFPPMTLIDVNSPAMILHSSGTTAFPSPISWTHNAWIQFGRIPHYGELDWTGLVLACHAVPMFHGMGIVQITLAPSTGLIAAMFRPRVPATVPDPVNTLLGTLATKSDLALVVPLFLDEWSKNDEYVKALTGIKGVIYGGGPLGRETGDYLTEKGVKIFVHYASTQTGIVSFFLPKQPEVDWEYFRISPNREVHFIPDGHGAVEAVVLASNGYTPNKLNTKINGKDAYATSDLFVAHPTIKGLYKVFGRTDDQIMHSTGEKTNPGPLENILARDPHIQAAVIFGRGQFNAGVIVQPKEPFVFDPTDLHKLASFRNLIWPSVQAVNDYAPSHSRIFKEMILVASPRKPLTYTPKGAPRRLAIIADYEAEIAAIYKAARESSQEDLERPADWSYTSVLTFVRKVVLKTLTRKDLISDDVNLFEIGCDSLQATWIRNSILRAVRKEHPQIARGLSFNLVFDYPSISALTLYISSSIAHNHRSNGLNGVVNGHSSNKAGDLQALVEKYTNDLPDAANLPPREAQQEGEVILLTGSTGSLGSSILAHLLRSPSVNHVYALGRLSNTPHLQNGRLQSALYDRHVAAFERHGLDVTLLHSPKVTFLVGDLTAKGLGIAPELSQEIESSLTHIIHNAWRVDFKLSVSSMEPMIAGVRNLVDFALSCTSLPKFVFVSSVGVARHATYVVPEVAFPSPDHALGWGYTEAKWVAERVLDTISRQVPLKSAIVRMGQLTGGPSGSWNEFEWFPSLVKSSVRLQCLPDVKGNISWLSCTDAAAALVDLAVANQKAPTAYYHLVHPRPTAWSQMIGYFSKALQLQILPYEEWFAILKELHSKLHEDHVAPDSIALKLDKVPALRLVDFFETAAKRTTDPSTEPLGVPRLKCQEALRASRALQNLQLTAVGREAVDKWVKNWSSSGFLY